MVRPVLTFSIALGSLLILAFCSIAQVADVLVEPQPSIDLLGVPDLPPASSSGETKVSVPSEKSSSFDYFTEYDNGLAIRPFDFSENPFDIQINGWVQFRYHAFSRRAETWTDRGGIVSEIRNRSVFDIERARLIFSGRAIDERLSYFLQVDGDTDGAEILDFLDYWWAWRHSDKLRIQFGKRKVPASQQWQLPARNLRLVERPMANDFFRPDRTTGLWANGQLTESLSYDMMLGNGFRTANVPTFALDNQFTIAAMSTWDLNGEYGTQLVDFGNVSDRAIQLGQSFFYTPNLERNIDFLDEKTGFLRLADGTSVTQTGSLGPGLDVTSLDVFFYGANIGLKHQGWSFNAELFLRWLNDLRGTGPLPNQPIFQRGYVVEGGRFLIDKTLDLNARYSQVTDLFGSASEYAIGGNWYPLRKRTFKFSLDVTYLDGSPLQNFSSDILAGDRGMLFRSQMQTEF